MTKTLTPLAMAAVLGLGLAGCGGGNETANNITAAETTVTAPPVENTTAAPFDNSTGLGGTGGDLGNATGGAGGTTGNATGGGG